jgi:phytol kinase
MAPLDFLHIGSFILIILCLWTLAGYLKVNRGLSIGYTRKLNHTFTLLLAAVWFLPLPLDVARTNFRIAGTILMFLLLIVCYAHTHPLLQLMFSGYARDKDKPHQAFHVWFSFGIGLLALLLVDALFNDRLILATAALLLGVGDALGEPIGMRFGKHRYRVGAVLCAQGSIRTLEGTSAVVLGSFLTAIVCLQLFSVGTSSLWIVSSAGILALVVAGIEAVTPHGLDNFTIPLGAALALHILYSFTPLI